MTCNICGGSTKNIYNGKIRDGRFGNFSKSNHSVIQCNECDIAYLNEYDVDYESGDYRHKVDGTVNPLDYYQLHDSEILQKLSVYPIQNYRNKIVMDIGCGGGSFLDGVKGLTKKTIAVEPDKNFSELLIKNGHQQYSYSEDAMLDYQEQVDLITSFAVIEHTKDCLSYLQSIYSLLRKGGKAIISTPNHNDWLLSVLGEDYKEFFYRTVHNWYLNEASLRNLAKRANLRVESVVFQQRYDLSNLMIWLRDKRPSGLAALPTLSSLDEIYKKELESRGLSDYLYIVLEK